MAKWGPKDPDAIRDYGVDWSADIGEGVTISSSAWLLNGEAWPVSPDLEKVASSNTNTTTTIRLAGGVEGISYSVTNHVVFSNGEEDDWTEKLKIKER